MNGVSAEFHKCQNSEDNELLSDHLQTMNNLLNEVLDNCNSVVYDKWFKS